MATSEMIAAGALVDAGARPWLRDDGVRDRWVTVRGHRIHYLMGLAPSPPVAFRGEASPPLLFLHGGGLGCAALTYAQCLAPLARHGRTIAPDWPGYGESEDHGGAHSTDGYIAFVADLLDALGIRRVRLCGLSMGGGVALGFTLAHPARVDRLILVNSHGLGAPIPYHVISNLAVRVPYINTLSWGGLRRSWRCMRRSMRGLLTDPAAITEELIAQSRTLVRAPATARAWRRWQRSEVRWDGMRTDYRDRLPDLTVPTLMLHSASDRIVPLAAARHAAALIPACRLRVFDCGHWLPRDRPDAFVRAVSAFLVSPESVT